MEGRRGRLVRGLRGWDGCDGKATLYKGGTHCEKGSHGFERL